MMALCTGACVVHINNHRPRMLEACCLDKTRTNRIFLPTAIKLLAENI
jgi:hypothetical protein